MSASAKARSRGGARTRGSRPSLPPTDGALVCDWIETFLVHGEGDWLGKPFRLTDDQRRLVYRIYERRPDGSRKHRQVLVGRPKGFGKTELGAALAVAELAGPLAPVAPDIPVAAASYEQANLLFGAARTMISEGPLRGHLEVFEREILRKDAPGRIYRVAAVAGTNDGGRHTFRVADEVHEWDGSKERVHIVLTNGLAKRKNSWALDISTAGSDTDSLIGWLYEKGKLIERGEHTDDSFLYRLARAPRPRLRPLHRASSQGGGEGRLPGSRRACRSRPDRRSILRDPRVRMATLLPEPVHAHRPRLAPQRRLATPVRQQVAEPPPPGTPIVLGFDGSVQRRLNRPRRRHARAEPVPCLLLAAGRSRKAGRTGSFRAKKSVPSSTGRSNAGRYGSSPAIRLVGTREIDEWAEQYGGKVVLRYQTNNPPLHGRKLLALLHGRRPATTRA